MCFVRRQGFALKNDLLTAVQTYISRNNSFFDVIVTVWSFQHIETLHLDIIQSFDFNLYQSLIRQIPQRCDIVFDFRFPRNNERRGMNCFFKV